MASATASALNETKSLVSKVREQLEQLQRKEPAEPMKLNAVKAQLKNAAEITSIETTKAEVSDAVKRVKECFFTLQHEYRTKWGLLKVCEGRLELRAKRPPSELVRDQAQEALEAEQKVLSAARVELQALCKEAKQAWDELEAVSDQLTRDLMHKRFPGTARMQKSLSLPQLPKTRGSPPASPSQREEPALEQLPSAELARCAAQREERALQVCRRSSEAVARIGQECSKAMERVAHCLDRRVAEMREMKAQLMEQAEEADSTIADADGVLRRLKRRTEDAETSKKMQQAEGIVAELKTSRQKLAEDYRCKTISLRVDESCKVLVARRCEARGPNQLRRTIQPLPLFRPT